MKIQLLNRFRQVQHSLLLCLALMMASCGNFEDAGEEKATDLPAVEENVETPKDVEESTKEDNAAEEVVTPKETVVEPEIEPSEHHQGEQTVSSSRKKTKVERTKPDEVREIEQMQRDRPREAEIRPSSPQSSGNGQGVTRSREIENITQHEGVETQVLAVESSSETDEPEVESQEKPSKPLEEYSVLLEIDSVIKLNNNGILTVWIGSEDIPERKSEGVARDETTIPASVGQYATVKPIAPNFDVDPPVKQCIRIHPSGSEVRFILTPKDSGNFRVSAQILLYDSINCNGPPVPKSASTLSVRVHVEKPNLFKSKLAEMGTILWENFLKFWGALLAVLFGFLIYKIRKKLKIKSSNEGEN